MSPTSRSFFAFIDALLLFLALEAVFFAVAYLGLHLSFDTPTPAYLTANLIWSVLAAGIAGYTTGHVARRAPVGHGVILAGPFILLAVFNLFKGVGGRRTAYVIAWNILVPLFCVLGSWLYKYLRRHHHRRRHA